MSQDLAIRSERVVFPGRDEASPATVWVSDGKIKAILSYTAPTEGADEINLGRLALLPGIVETHAHLNEPGRTEWEGFETATWAAAAGGITTLIDMPLNSIPATVSQAALQAKVEASRGKCLIDHGFWGGVIPGNTSELEGMVNSGVIGFKAFMIESGVDEFSMSDEAVLRKAMPILAKLGVPLLVHAELEMPLQGELTPEDPRKYSRYLHSRPQAWEVEAIRLIIRLAEETRCAVHVVHLSAADALNEIQAAKSRGVPITVETCPHYLVFEAEKIPDGATFYKCAPPIREATNRERLWQGLESAKIDCIVSDHSPCTPALKNLDSGDFDGAWGGIAGLQFSVSSVWTEMKERGLPLGRLSRWMSERTSRLAGLQFAKGRIAVGADADLIAFDPDGEFKIDRREIFHRHKVTPYQGKVLQGVVRRTWLRGETVYEWGDSAPPRERRGQWVKREQKEKS